MKTLWDMNTIAEVQKHRDQNKSQKSRIALPKQQCFNLFINSTNILSAFDRPYNAWTLDYYNEQDNILILTDLCIFFNF